MSKNDRNYGNYELRIAVTAGQLHFKKEARIFEEVAVVPGGFC